MAEIIEFPTQDPPPHFPGEATKLYLAHNKCNAVISFRVPRRIKQRLMQEAWVSNARFSRHMANLATEHALEKCLRCQKKAA